jgi:ectoine hydroxylase-related dioxygenase (phytanoyl-CoA dioxygenase family)
MLNFKIDHNNILNELNSNGYCIVKDVINLDILSELKKFWLSYIVDGNVSKKFVRGDLIFGEKNFLSFSKINDWCLYRNFDFLWNEPTNLISQQLCIAVNSVRNEVQGFPLNHGLHYNSDNYGIYISTSLYPPHTGMLKEHSDGHKNVPIVHFMIPLSFKKIDYESGGLFVKDHNGIKVDIDALCSPGDLIFFDGRLPHGVDVIQGGSVGRLAIFAIPCFFNRQSFFNGKVRSLKIFLFEILSIFNLNNFFNRRK